MNAYFFDTSALVKRYAVENGSDWVRSVADSAGIDIYIAAITTVEVTSAVTRKVRGQHLTQADADRIFRWFDAHCEHQYSVASILDDDLDRARALAAAYGLRAYDAVQLSVCLALQLLRTENEGPPITFVCSDSELIDAARKEGLAVVNPAEEQI